MMDDTNSPAAAGGRPRHCFSTRVVRRGVGAFAIAVGMGCVGGPLASVESTGAAMTDRATLNLNSGSQDSGIGFPHRFDIGVVLPDGTVEQADGADGFDWIVPEAESLVPGRSVTTTIPVFNNTPTLGADTSFRVVLRNGDGQVGPDIPNITEFLRFSASDSSGSELFTDVGWADARASLGVLSARDGEALGAGDAYVAGAPGSADEIVLTISYPDVPGVEDYNGGQSAISVSFDAVSITP